MSLPNVPRNVLNDLLWIHRYLTVVRKPKIAHLTSGSFTEFPVRDKFKLNG
jgi:hypothetical protein